MSKLLSAPRALFVLGFGMLGGCSGLSADGWSIDAAEMTPITTTSREPSCSAPAPAPAPAPAAAMAPAAAYERAARTEGPLARFFLHAPLSSAVAAAAAPGAAAAPAPAEQPADWVDRNTSKVRDAMGKLPPKLQNDKVIQSILDLVVQRKQQMLASTMGKMNDASLQPQLAAASAAAHAPISGQQLTQAASSAAAGHQPAKITIAGIKNLHQALVSYSLERGVNYVSYYFDGSMVDRLGNKIAVPTFTGMKVTDADITGLLVTLLESAVDDAIETPVWYSVAADGKTRTYYPGGTGTSPPSALTYSAYEANPQKPDITTAPILEKMAPTDLGCGMTTLKAQAARYLANDAAVWAGSGTGLVMGLFGGVELGPFVAFGKISIGDNQMLQSIVQALITFAARRGTYEAIWPRLWGHYQTPDDRLSTVVSMLKIVSPTDPSAKSSATSP